MNKFDEQLRAAVQHKLSSQTIVNSKERQKKYRKNLRLKMLSQNQSETAMKTTSVKTRGQTRSNSRIYTRETCYNIVNQ